MCKDWSQPLLIRDRVWMSRQLIGLVPPLVSEGVDEQDADWSRLNEAVVVLWRQRTSEW